MATASEILRDAAQLIRERGWCQNSLRSPEGRLCAVGAIKVAAYGSIDAEWEGAGDEAWGALSKHVKSNPANWNDRSGRTAEEVIAVLEAAAERVKAEPAQ